MSSRIPPVDPATAQGHTRELLDSVRARMGITPNMMRIMAHSPAVLESYLNFSSALTRSSLNPKVRQQIALYVSQINGCQYCISAHSMLGKNAGLSPDQLIAARKGDASDPKARAAIRLAQSIMERHGDVPDAQLTAARSAGLTNGEITEVAAHVALAIMTNYFNQLAHTEIDFPVVSMAL